jgi:hypothetical protein
MNDVFQVLKEVKCQTRLQDPANLYFEVKGEIMKGRKKHKLRQFMTTMTAFKKIYKGILHRKE